ncbi:hypothetical protein PoB_006497000 [Plakobranchus ocellatus]|uniref:C-type lectin domain-containing protein n=1 Tax=Plakobranchus ocellatus TaxID=259542 RepID=A0AAV4D2Z6_9GAST|nr:hypothetical protein PoB_006497000 [Plakobranchus ocellatus]
MTIGRTGDPTCGWLGLIVALKASGTGILRVKDRTFPMVLLTGWLMSQIMLDHRLQVKGNIQRIIVYIKKYVRRTFKPDENCMVMAPGNWKWNDIACDSYKFPLCEISEQDLIALNGY